MASFTHLLLTRFCIRSDPLAKPPSEEWLNHRMTLFERYCLPSVQAQTTSAFQWILFLDEGTPEKFRNRLSAHGMSNLRLVYVRDFLAEYRAKIAPFINEDYVITTRVDNDDALGIHHMKDAQACFDFQEREFINFTNGYLLDHFHKKLYEFRHTSNPFISLIERSQGFLGVYCAWHNRVQGLGTVAQRADRRNWMMVVHDRNILNSVPSYLRRVPLARSASEFNSIHGSAPVPNQVAERVCVAVDNTLRYGTRIGRRVRRALGLLCAMTCA